MKSSSAFRPAPSALLRAAAIWERVQAYSELVVLPHSVFALPFALVSLLAASEGRPGWALVGWTAAAVAAARTAAMAYNRLMDADVDAENPRTKGRPIPSGRVGKGEAAALTLASSAVFLWVCANLNPLVFHLAPAALLLVLFYSHTKRFTWASHFVLGLALGAAPVGAWIAAAGAFAVEPFWLAGAVLCFVAGFDILYAVQDEAFDRRRGLHSFVVRWGVARSVAASRLLHVLMLGFLAAFGASAGLPPAAQAGALLATGALLVYQHTRGVRFERGGGAPVLSPRFFTVNGWIAVAYFLTAGVSLCF